MLLFEATECMEWRPTGYTNSTPVARPFAIPLPGVLQLLATNLQRLFVAHLCTTRLTPLSTGAATPQEQI